MDDADLNVLRAFRDTEQSLGRWSQEVQEMLLGMKISPMFVTWQHGKPRIITDHSASELNAEILQEYAKVRYDDMHDFGQTLHDACLANIGRRLVLYKDDVVSAFLNLPAHPLWQIRQIAVVDRKLQILRRLVFGNRASPHVWCIISGLMCWIAIQKFSVLDLFVYMDDFYGWDYEDNMIFYHGQWRPNPQVTLLQFWEYIPCPFDDEKQKHGRQLKIISVWLTLKMARFNYLHLL